MKKHSNRTVNGLVFLFILTSIVIANLAMAYNTPTPDHKIREVFTTIEQNLKQLKQKSEFTHANIKTLLNTHLLPEIDTRYFALKSLGKHTISMDEETKLAYITELQRQLINSYANLLNKYENEKIVFGKGAIAESGKIAQVTLVIESQGKTNNAVVKLVKSAKEEWLIFDLVIQGVSLLQTKQAELNSSINKLGISGTLDKLKMMNEKSNIASTT